MNTTTSTRRIGRCRRFLASFEAAPLKDAVKQRAARAFQLLGEAEAAIHSIPIEKVHFHEVGAVDTIVDIVCAAAGCEALGVDRWMASPLNVGSGTVKCAHGTLPVPAPATLALLGDAPVYAAGPADGARDADRRGVAAHAGCDVRAAAGDARGSARLRSGRARHAGRAEPAAAAGGRSGRTEADGQRRPIAVIETVIDDATPQLLAYVSELLLEAGAWDVYRAPVQMKKGRTGVQMTVLSSPELMPALRDLLLRETTTIGLRWRMENKMALAREFAEVETEWGKVRIKIARWPSGEVANASPEYEVCRNIARAARSSAETGDAGGDASVCGESERAPTKKGTLMDRSQIEALLNEVRDGIDRAWPMRWSGCAICRSRIWALPSWIIIARCARACRR